MANPIRPEDIIDEQGVVQSLKNVQENLRLLKEAMKGKAKDIKITINGGGDMSGFIAQINALTEAMGKLNEFSKVNADYLKTYTAAQREANRATRSRKSASDDYYETLRKLNKEERELEKIREATENTEKLLSGEVKATALSYNQLSAVYSEMSSRLKNLNKDQIEGSAEMKRYAATTKMVRDAMNEAQKAMGNYSLNVGRYHTAFDGLGYSIQQVIREVPSAVNISQFFLAISNNIPMVVEQMKLFNEEQANLKKQLGELQGGTKEYMELQQKQMSLGQKVLKSIFSWQTALLGVLLLLRNYDKILDGIKKLWDNVRKVVKEANNEIELGVNKAKLYTSVLSRVSKNYVELGLILRQINDAASGTNEWKNAIERVNEITGSTLDATTATVDAVKKVTGEYKKQAMQIAINNKIVDMQAEDMMNRAKRERIFNNPNMSFDSVTSTLGVTGDKEKEEIKKAYDRYQKTLRKVIELRNKARKGNYQEQHNAEKFLYNDAYGGYENRLKRYATEYRNAVNTYAPIMDQATQDWMNSLYAAMPEGKNNGEKKGKPTKEETPADRRFEAMEAMLANMADGYQKDIALAKVAYEKAIFEEENFYKQEQEKAKENVEELAKLKREHDQIVIGLGEEYNNKNNEIWEKYEKMRIEAEIADSDVVMKQTKRRVKLREDEIRNNAIVMENIARLMAEKERLEAIDTKGIEEEEKKKQEAIDKTTAAIERQRNALSWEKQLANYKNIGDMLGSGDWLSGLAGGDKRDFLTALGLNMEGASDEQVDSAFDVWEKNATEAMVKWKDMTIDNLGQMLDAYVEYYQAKADAASEDTDKAKEAYEMQKSLLEQGYANSVNTAWAEYRQKQEIQKKAEEDAKRAQQVQKLADEAQNFSNMVLATSNILKQYSANPIVATGLISTMWLTYGAAKAMALKESKYEHGGYEELTGGSHVSGHDINLGVMNGKGRSMVAEGGESIGIFSRNAKRKYGSQTIGEIVKSINNGTYEKVSAERLNDNVSLTVRPYRGASVNLNKIENTLDSIDRNGKHTSYVDGNGNMVVVNGNSTTTYIKR